MTYDSQAGRYRAVTSGLERTVSEVTYDSQAGRYRAVASLLITGGRFPQILDLFQGFKLGVPSGCLGETSSFTARRVCVARTMPSQDVRLSVCPSVTRRY